MRARRARKNHRRVDATCRPRGRQIHKLLLRRVVVAESDRHALTTAHAQARIQRPVLPIFQSVRRRRVPLSRDGDSNFTIMPGFSLRATRPRKRRAAASERLRPARAASSTFNRCRPGLFGLLLDESARLRHDHQDHDSVAITILLCTFPTDGWNRLVAGCLFEQHDRHY
jgi:hypothetical protein